MPMVSSSATRSSRARSSRRWSASAIRPPSPTGSCGLARNHPKTPAKDMSVVGQAGSDLGVAARLLRALVRGPLVLEPLGLGAAPLGVELALLVGLGVVVVVVHQALGLGLEDAQRATTAAGQLGQLLGPEEQQDDEN